MQLKTRFYWCFAVLVLASSANTVALQPTLQNPSESNPTALPSRQQPTEYVLGPNDQIVISAANAEEITGKPTRISITGDINVMQGVGRIHAAGMTVRELEAEIAERLKRIIRVPEVSITVSEFRSQPVTVTGAVGKPGTTQLEGGKSLLEVLAAVGGAQVEASSIVTITRDRNLNGPIPLASASSPDGSPYSVAKVNIRSVQEGRHPEENIRILPQDVIHVPQAPLVYATGEIRKPGAYALKDRNTVSMIQLIAMAEGTAPNAKTKEVRIVRPVEDSTREERIVDFEAIRKGKAPDITLQPGDILYVPGNAAKGALRKTLDALVGMAPGMAIYGF
jgi:polysaccharide biosynthesis/export protein